jgi:hypothetical protein
MGPVVPRDHGSWTAWQRGPQVPRDQGPHEAGKQGNWEPRPIGTLAARNPGAMAHRSPGSPATMPSRSPVRHGPSTPHSSWCLDTKVPRRPNAQAPAKTQGPSYPAPWRPIRLWCRGSKVLMAPRSCSKLAASHSSAELIPGLDWSLIKLGFMVPWQPFFAGDLITQRPGLPRPARRLRSLGPLNPSCWYWIDRPGD